MMGWFVPKETVHGAWRLALWICENVGRVSAFGQEDQPSFTPGLPASATVAATRSRPETDDPELKFSLPCSPPTNCQCSRGWWGNAHLTRTKPPQIDAHNRICALGSEPSYCAGWVFHLQKTRIRSQNPRLWCRTSDKWGRQIRAYT